MLTWKWEVFPRDPLNKSIMSSISYKLYRDNPKNRLSYVYQQLTMIGKTKKIYRKTQPIQAKTEYRRDQERTTSKSLKQQIINSYLLIGQIQMMCLQSIISNQLKTLTIRRKKGQNSGKRHEPAFYEHFKLFQGYLSSLHHSTSKDWLFSRRKSATIE